MEASREQAWENMLTSEYNRIFCVHRAARYGTLAKSLDWGVLLVSGGAVASWAAGLPAGVSVGISLLVAALGGTSRAFQWQHRAAHYQFDSERWAQQQTQWKEIYDLLSRNERVTRKEFEVAVQAFKDIMGRDQERIPEKLDAQLHRQVLRQVGMSPTAQSSA